MQNVKRLRPERAVENSKGQSELASGTLCFAKKGNAP